MKIILRNRQKHNDKKELTLEEFKKEFYNELHCAIQTYTNHQQQKDWCKPPYMVLNKDYTLEFYSSLHFNFNNNAQTLWYIDRII